MTPTPHSADGGSAALGNKSSDLVRHLATLLLRDVAHHGGFDKRFQVIPDHVGLYAAERCNHGVNLVAYIDAVAPIGDHLLEAADLALDPAQPGKLTFVPDLDAAVGALGPSCHGPTVAPRQRSGQRIVRGLLRPTHTRMATSAYPSPSEHASNGVVCRVAAPMVSVAIEDASSTKGRARPSKPRLGFAGMKVWVR